MRKMLGFIVALVAILAPLVPGFADGIIIPIPGSDIPGPPLRWLTIVYHHVTVTIENGVATTKVDQAFRNDGEFPIEGTYVFPVPPGAVLQNFSLWVHGEPAVGGVLPADEAREIYLSYLRQARDPALLEYIGQGAFRARIFPIEPGETRRVALEYVELLPPEGGLFRYRYPLSPERFSAKPLEEVKVEVVVKESRPVGSVYSPTHTVTVSREAPTSGRALYQEEDVLPDRDFILYYSLAGDGVGLDFLAYKPDDEDGFFLVLVTPPAVRDLAPLPKDLVLVIDRSGSMDGEKMVQARDAAAFILERLAPEDRFGVVAFDHEILGLTSGLVSASAANVSAAQREVRQLTARGMTDIHDALLQAMEWLQPADRPQYVLFLTDGLPTQGKTDTDAIVRDVTAANRARARVFTFGVGYDVNTQLLDLLAEQNRGTTTYVVPGESLEVALSSFYTKIAAPALTDLALEVDGVEVSDLYPVQLPDLFYGSQLALFGRYEGSGEATIVLTGERGPEDVVLTYNVEFPAAATEASTLPRLWAARKIGHLLNLIRLKEKTEDELKPLIIELATKYGIATPYTSFLVREEERATVAPPPTAYMMRTGESAVRAAQAAKSLAAAETAQSADYVREVGGRVFLFVDGTWQESTYEEDTPTVNIAYLSDAYFALLDRFPGIGPILALGEKVIFKLGTAWVRIGAGGVTELTPEVRAQFQG